MSRNIVRIAIKILTIYETEKSHSLVSERSEITRQ